MAPSSISTQSVLVEPLSATRMAFAFFMDAKLTNNLFKYCVAWRAATSPILLSLQITHLILNSQSYVIHHPACQPHGLADPGDRVFLLGFHCSRQQCLHPVL